MYVCTFFFFSICRRSLRGDFTILSGLGRLRRQTLLIANPQKKTKKQKKQKKVQQNHLPSSSSSSPPPPHLPDKCFICLATYMLYRRREAAAELHVYMCTCVHVCI
uniref:Uncharacterized protein n=1 Tax=Lotharella globosa TaxID=91324 RepID=A0A7S3Z4M9_9EUKA